MFLCVWTKEKESLGFREDREHHVSHIYLTAVFLFDANVSPLATRVVWKVMNWACSDELESYCGRLWSASGLSGQRSGCCCCWSAGSSCSHAPPPDQAPPLPPWRRGTGCPDGAPPPKTSPSEKRRGRGEEKEKRGTTLLHMFKCLRSDEGLQPPNSEILLRRFCA